MNTLKFNNFLNEALDPEAWLSLKTDTSNKFTIPSPKFETVSNHIAHLLRVSDIADIIFISPDPGFLDMNKDYLIINNKVMELAKEITNKVVNEGDITTYLHLYKYEEIHFVLAEMRDIYEYGFVFITKEDFNKLNEFLFQDEAEMISLTDEGVQEQEDEFAGDLGLQDAEPENMEDFDQNIVDQNEEGEQAQDEFDFQEDIQEEEAQEEKMNLLKNPKQ